jgi:hypothetical protein
VVLTDGKAGTPFVKNEMLELAPVCDEVAKISRII